MIPVEDILSLVAPKNVKISPDGKRVVYAAAPPYKTEEHAVSAIWLADVGVQHSSKQVTSGLYNDQAPSWSPKGDLVAFVSDRAKKGESQAIYLFAPNSGEAYPITKTEHKKDISRFRWSPDGSWIAFSQPDEIDPKKEEGKDSDANVYNEEWPHNRLHMVHVATRKVSTLVKKDAHVKDLAWSPNSKSIIYTLAPSPELDHNFGGRENTAELIQIGSKQSETLCVLPSNAATVNDSNIVWVGEYAYLVGSFHGDHPHSAGSVWALNIEKKSIERCCHGEDDTVESIASTGDNMVIETQKALSTHLSIVKGDRRIWGQNGKVRSWDVKPLDDDFKRYIIALAKGEPGNPYEVYSSMVEPEKVAVLSQISDHGRTYRDKGEESSSEFLHCKSSDGKFDIDGILMRPRRADSDHGETFPTIVIPHGGPYYSVSADFTGMQPFHNAALTSAGYAVLLPNFRGGAGHGHAFAEAVCSDLGGCDYDDIMAVTQHAIDQGLVDKHQLMIGGWSYGGYVSYLATVRNGLHPVQAKGDWSFRAAVCGGGISDWEALPGSGDLWTWPERLIGSAPWTTALNDTKSRQGSPLRELKDGDRRRREEKLGRNAKYPPVLILHCDNDVRVPVSQAHAFRRAAKHYNIDCEMVTYPKEGHGPLWLKNNVDILKRTIAFADMHMK